MLCPTNDSFFEATDENAFTNLPAADNEILNDMPNHLLIHPLHFTKSDGSKTMIAKSFTMEIIKQLQIPEEEAETGTPEWEEVDSEKESVGGLLAFLWASEQGLLLSPVAL
jgi:hypothetical protein